MTAPVPQLLNSMETLLRDGRPEYGILPMFPLDSGVTIYRSDALTEAAPPMVILAQTDAAKELHKRGSGMWDIPVSAKYIMSRNGDDGDTPTDVEDIFRDFGDKLEALFAMDLLLVPDDQDGGFSTPEERLTTEEIHVFRPDGIMDHQVMSDTELDGDPSAEITFTARCAHASKIIPAA